MKEVKMRASSAARLKEKYLLIKRLEATPCLRPMFHEAIGVTGLILTKLDGTAKGGIVVGIAREMNIPVRFIGVGEDIEDLREFNPREFTEALFKT
jgi:flagellar biosynthesis GTPase FlhF